MIKEKRRAKRVKENAEVTITMTGQEDLSTSGRTTYQMAKDVSLFGIRILSNTFVPVNSTLKIDLTLGAQIKPITTFGKVRWVKSLYGDELFEMGIEFADTPLEISRILKDHIAGKPEDSA